MLACAEYESDQRTRQSDLLGWRSATATPISRSFIKQFGSYRSAFLVATVSLDCRMILIGKLLLAVLAGAVIITAL